MFQVMLQSQWKSARQVVLLATIFAFFLPLLSLRVAQQAATPLGFMGYMQSWSVFYAVLAAGLGLVVALLAWSADHRGRHVYALTLPIARWRFVALRFTAGLVALVPPTVALGIGALIVAASSTVPPGLHAYPMALTLRFAFAALVAYSIFFAISSATARTAGYILGAAAVVLIAQLIASTAGFDANIVGHVADVVFGVPGLLAVFSGRWMLIDA